MSKHEHKDCHHLLSSLSDYVDGALEEQLCQEIERHVSGCEDCRIVIDTLEKTIYLYHTSAASEPPGVPEDVKERLFKRLDLEDFLPKAS
ncbi:MAG TPA: hypothetical protein DEH25_08240 [Chloroflexi bacterium]|nr:hypothetical protein [Chloroflexota bacterium]HBY07054.1 hypothetical protein [Chloroflexota bacterium]